MFFHISDLIIGTACVIAALVSWQLSQVLGERFNFERDTDGMYFVQIVSGVIAGVLAGFGAAACLDVGGYQLGIIADVLTMPAIGAIWLTIVGGNSAIERIAANLLNKLDR